ncbi:sn-glycerol-3-phosphate ABC transporter ATP-binding protein UgpC [Natronococcus sp. A-GB7]|uniref:ABC transporter ATP-binding protein n=1 Tax=Natronococcus sp. A-GB7 TaxID=3037649 RepID=UPI00241D8ED5|nr:sn-glycerol-3-phosphate ABC transporter ATP-binding protein UgpC [Natronococcus sp. A-GB7]MDG5818220.1 sn-glycerol-3-phosphate ABC transporter ATP-binding protein UgpC [Natronococcus sp. A-GB7]
MATLTLENVTKRFADGDDEIVAVDDVSIEIDDGEFLVLVGPSGCGKSTTLRMVAGLETISEGAIAIDDEIINDVPAQRRDIAMVFQSYALYPHMTVRENMRFGLEESTDLDAETMDGSVERTAELLEIEELLDRKPGELSGGQQQRVALGRAIVRDPAVFLMDEPLSNLDAKLRAGMRMELQRLQNELDVTTVYVTHDQTEAMTMGDRIAILDGGRLQQVATPLECYHRPRNLFVAGFIGEPSMNFFDATLEGDELLLEGTELSYPLSASIREELEGETELVLGVRPEDVEIAAESTDDHAFPVTVDVVEPMGNENNLLATFEGSELSVNAIVDGMRHVEAGQRYAARLPESAIHLFDRSSGRALHNRRIDDEEKLLETRV